MEREGLLPLGVCSAAVNAAEALAKEEPGSFPIGTPAKATATAALLNAAAYLKHIESIEFRAAGAAVTCNNGHFDPAVLTGGLLSIAADYMHKDTKDKLQKIPYIAGRMIDAACIITEPKPLETSTNRGADTLYNAGFLERLRDAMEAIAVAHNLSPAICIAHKQRDDIGERQIFIMDARTHNKVRAIECPGMDGPAVG